METPADHANNNLNQLHALSGEGAVVSGERLVPGLWFDIDPDAGGVDARYTATEGGFLTLRSTAETPGRWFTLNIDLGAGDLGACRLLGYAARSRAPRSLTLRACVRSFRSGRFEDVFFPQYLVSFGEDSSHSDVLWIADYHLLSQPADWRTLLLFLDPAGFEITLSDLRVFAA